MLSAFALRIGVRSTSPSGPSGDTIGTAKPRAAPPPAWALGRTAMHSGVHGHESAAGDRVRAAGGESFDLHDERFPGTGGPADEVGDGESTWLEDTVAQAVERYREGDYEQAIAGAVEALRGGANDYDAERMLRIAASSSCFLGQAAQARMYYVVVSPRGRPHVELDCTHAGVALASVEPDRRPVLDSP